jgi:ABC-type nitrate/sulfonate/bicarbonate transport system permease component
VTEIPLLRHREQWLTGHQQVHRTPVARDVDGTGSTAAGAATSAKPQDRRNRGVMAYEAATSHEHSAADLDGPHGDLPSTDRRSALGRPGRRMLVLVLRLGFILAAIGVWQIVVATGMVSKAAVAEPSAVARELPAMISDSNFWSAVWATIRTWAIGLIISMGLAIPIGLLLGSSDAVYRVCRFTIDFLRTIPPVALIPLALLLYGATEKMALLLVIFGSTGPLLLQSMYGAQQVDPQVRAVARAYLLRRRDIALRVVLPSAAPFIATGIRISATISLLLAVGAELIGGAPGLGANITVDAQTNNIPQMYAYIVTCAALGAALNLMMMSLERRTIAWVPGHRS